jgi:hypothetical protein
MTKQKLLGALEEFVSAYEDAMRRDSAGDDRAIKSNALRATYEQATEVIRQSRREIAMGEFV